MGLAQCPISAPAALPPADFWRSGTGATLPDGTADVTEDISREGKIGLGTTTPVTDIHVKKATTGEVGVTVENTLTTANDYADFVALNGDVKTSLGAYKAGALSGNGVGYVGTESNHDLFISAGNNTAIVVKPNQRVGIGSNASVNNPTDTLYVHNGNAGDSGLTLAGLPAATSPTAGAQPIGVDANGKVVRVSGGGVVPAFATPAETITGTATNLIVNPADLYARENIPAQTGLGLVLSAIPAPTASQSNWGVNTLGETLHFAPGLGWQIVQSFYNASGSVGGQAIAAGFTVLSSIAMPRAGKVLFEVEVGTVYLQGQVILAFVDTTIAGTRSDAISGVEPISQATGVLNVLAGQVVTLQVFSAPMGGSTVYNKWKYTYLE